MRPAKLELVIAGLAASVACGIGHSAQHDNTQTAIQDKNRNTSPQEETKFLLVQTSVGVTKSGATWGGKTYATLIGLRVYLYIVRLDSREGARKEYEETLKGAMKIVKQEKVQDKAATKPATTEDRAVIISSAIKECNEPTTIVATAGRALRIIKSCSAEAALEFERQASQRERE